ncbi:hypothetical protein [Ignatzschineria sp. LJL83]
MLEQEYDDSPLTSPKGVNGGMIFLFSVIGFFVLSFFLMGIRTELYWLSIIAIAFVAFIAGLFYPSWKPTVMRKKLSRTGVIIEADFLDITKGSYSSGDYSPCRFRAQWLDSEMNAVYHFVSPNLNVANLDYLKSYPEKISADLATASIKVVINPDNPKEYYMEKEEILKFVHTLILPNVEAITEEIKQREWQELQQALEAESRKLERQRKR